MNLPNNIQEQLQATPNKGVCCNFVKVDDNWGIKAYWIEEDRDESQENQQKYAEFGLAPPCQDEKFKIGDYHCFATRVANIITCPSLYQEDREAWYELGREYEGDIEDWHREAGEAGFPVFYDDHIGNFGWYEGKFVLIDCGNGHES